MENVPPVLAPVFEMLMNDGYRPAIIEGVISVKIEGGEYLLVKDADGDTGFYQLLYPSLWVEEGASTSERLLDAANVANSNTKFAKIQIYGDSVHCVLQALHKTHNEFYENFPRYISAMQYSYTMFVKRVRG